jgi:hypothetical protein
VVWRFTANTLKTIRALYSDVEAMPPANARVVEAPPSAVSCNLLDEAGRAIAVKVIRFRKCGSGSSVRDAGFPVGIRGAGVTCRTLNPREDTR